MDPGILIAASVEQAERSAMGLFLLGALIVTAIFGAISGAVARGKGHGFWPFFFLGALISPVLAIILVFVIAPPKRAKARWRSRRTIPMRPAKRGRNGTASFYAASRR